MVKTLIVMLARLVATVRNAPLLELVGLGLIVAGCTVQWGVVALLIGAGLVLVLKSLEIAQAPRSTGGGG